MVGRFGLKRPIKILIAFATVLFTTIFLLHHTQTNPEIYPELQITTLKDKVPYFNTYPLNNTEKLPKNPVVPDDFNYNEFSKPYLLENGEFNEDFFHNFQHHEDGISSRKLSRENTKLYSDVLMKPIQEPKVENLAHPSENYQLANATLLSLVRNSELEGLIGTMEMVERTFNDKFHYPWTFINDVEFSNEFKRTVYKYTKSKIHFIIIPSEIWSKPNNIDPEKEREGIEKMLENSVGYADMESYHNMCRFYSGNFYNLPHLQQFKYYWRIEPDTKYHCDIDYDVFKFMETNGKTYGFNINLYDGPDSIVSLWNTTIDFLQKNPQYINPNGAFDWLLEDMQNPEKNAKAGYSTCHFWSNFEIANMDFFRSEAYNEWFKFLDESGGFYYERWGDAPIHAIGLALFEDKKRIHWFKDIGYTHFPFTNCPNSDKCRCEAAEFVPWFNLEIENCMATWIKYGMSEDEKEMWNYEN